MTTKLRAGRILLSFQASKKNPDASKKEEEKKKRRRNQRRVKSCRDSPEASVPTKTSYPTR
jgi:hypothetical protein